MMAKQNSSEKQAQVCVIVDRMDEVLASSTGCGAMIIVLEVVAVVRI